MKFNEASFSDIQLKVFSDESTELDDRSAIDAQFPFMDRLIEQFELVTGWNLEFFESLSSHNKRALMGQSSGEKLPIDGELKITDLSDKLEAGGSARHRGYCEQLVLTLDSMIQLIQSDRQRLIELETRLEPVVDVPYEWWGIDGQSGFGSGNFSSWSISANEKLRLFGGKTQSSSNFDDTLAATTLISSFETACQATLPMHDVAPLLPAMVQRSRYLESKLDWFVTVELDPITGEYQTDGFNSSDGLALIDVDAGTAFRLGESDVDGTLYSGQILCVGVSDTQLNCLNEKLTGQEKTLEQCRKILNAEFADSPAIFIFRK